MIRKNAVLTETDEKSVDRIEGDNARIRAGLHR